MLNDLSRAPLAGAWCAALVAIGSLGLVAGAPVTPSTIGLWLVTCLVPTSVMLVAWRGAPPRTTANVVCAVTRPPV